MYNKVCDKVKNGVGIMRDLIDHGPFDFTRNEKYLAATTNASYNLDITYSGSMLERM